jgi:hypothetical protein
MSEETPDTEKRVSPTKLYTEEEREAGRATLYEMWAQRATLTQMADTLGINMSTAKRWLDRAIAERQTMRSVADEMRRDLELSEIAIRALMPKMLRGEPIAHRALISWLERRAKYLGLDKPEELNFNLSGSTGPVEEELKMLLQQLGLPEIAATVSTEDAEETDE